MRTAEERKMSPVEEKTLLCVLQKKGKCRRHDSLLALHPEKQDALFFHTRIRGTYC